MTDAMLTATKEFTWDMAHMLAGHEGLCRNVHGHTYRMEVTVERIGVGPLYVTGPSSGMVVDFKDLKDIVKAAVVDPLDHAFMYWVGSGDAVEHAIADVLRQGGRKVAEVGFRPTAENMAVEFYHTINNYASSRKYAWRVVRIRLWETPTSYAEVAI